MVAEQLSIHEESEDREEDSPAFIKHFRWIRFKSSFNPSCRQNAV